MHAFGRRRAEGFAGGARNEITETASDDPAVFEEGRGLRNRPLALRWVATDTVDVELVSRVLFPALRKINREPPPGMRLAGAALWRRFYNFSC